MPIGPRIPRPPVARSGGRGRPRRSRSGTVLAGVAVAAFLATGTAWRLQARARALPPAWNEVDLAVSGLH